MTTYIILLRGINVGGQKKIPMAELRSILNAGGFESVSTYIQSGNIILQSSKRASEVEKSVDRLIQEKFGFAVSIQVKAKRDWQVIVDNNPFSKYSGNELYLKKLNVTFLKEALAAEEIKKIKNESTQNEDCEFRPNCIYIWCGDGLRNSKMAELIVKNPHGTTRNWNTVSKIAEKFLA